MAINAMMQAGSSPAGRELPGFWSRSAATYLSGSLSKRLAAVVNGTAGMDVRDRGVPALVAPSHWDSRARTRPRSLP